MRLPLSISVMYWTLFLVSQVTIVFSRMIPYYLGGTLIMVDSFDSNLPTRNRPSSDDIAEVVPTFIDNYSERIEELPNNFDDNYISSVKVISDVISTANDNNDFNSKSKDHVYAQNIVKFAPTILIKDKNNNIVEHPSSPDVGDDVSFNGIVEFVNKPHSYLTTGNKDVKTNTKVTFVDSNGKHKTTNSLIKTSSEHDSPVDTISHSDINVKASNELPMDSAIKNMITETMGDTNVVDKSTLVDFKTIIDRDNIISNKVSANDSNETDDNATSNFIMEYATNGIKKESNIIIADEVTDKLNRPLKAELKISDNEVGDADVKSKLNIRDNDSSTDQLVGDLLSESTIRVDGSIGLNDNLKSEATTEEKVGELTKLNDATDGYSQSSDIGSTNGEKDKDELLVNIEETLNNYFKADNEETRTETLTRKLQKILSFLKMEDKSVNSRTFNFFQGLKGMKLGNTYRNKRDIGQKDMLSRSDNNKHVSQKHNNLRHKKENSIESVELDYLNALSYINPPRALEVEKGFMEDLINNRAHLESSSDESDDSEMDENESLDLSHERLGIPSRKISEGEELPIRTDDYIDYDVDYYDYFDFSNHRIDPGTNDSEIIDEFINSILNEFGNYSQVDEFGNYVEIIDTGNFTETDEYDIENSTDSSLNVTIVTGVGEIDNLELLLSKKTCRCGVPVSKTKIKRIVKGEDTTINNHPWMVQIAEKRDRVTFCGGSIITDLHIVTAAHCVVGYHPKELFVRMGETNATNKISGRKAFIKSIVVHPKYRTRDGTKFDIAIIRLRRPIKYTEAVLPVCLSSHQDNEDKIGTIVGWGSKSEMTDGSTVLQETKVNIMEADSCRNESAYKQHEIPNRVFCAKGNGTDSCQGDSGGPLTIEEESQYYLAGITSWGIGCGVEQYPGVYTKVSLYIGWIKTKTKEALYCQPDGRNQIRKLPKKYFEKY